MLKTEENSKGPPAGDSVSVIGISGFAFVSDFGIRISDFDPS
jgi:hypothetical protein